eukprot:12209475-Ditylum_brightwellii.AAC.1
MKKTAGRILTCEVYDKIDDTALKMVSLNYKQVEKLQAIIAAHHCPEMLEKPVDKNIDASREMQVLVVLNKNKIVVSFDTWVEAKGELLDWGYQLKKVKATKQRQGTWKTSCLHVMI